MPVPDRFHGLLIVDKPAGWTSHDVVGKIRRLIGQRSVGHAGTLDPAATGVLPVGIGSALRALEYLTDATKSYQADITFGLTTDALDIEGRITGVCAPPALNDRELRAILNSMVGRFEQIPPVYSAIKIDGTPLYARARRGEMFEPPKRSVEIERLQLVRWESPTATVAIDCSKGFYVRSFARDLGERTDSCAFLSNLVRTRVGQFDLCDAWTLDELAAAPLPEEWERIAIAPDATALSLPAVLLDQGHVLDWEHGKRWALDDADGEGPVRVYDSAGAWLGIGELTRNDSDTILHPRKVIPTRTLHTGKRLMPGQVSFQELDPLARVVTIGTFDGVHRGHRKLIERTRNRAIELGARSLIVTFEPIPASVLRPDKFSGRICTAGRKLTLLEALETDEIAIIEFDRTLAARTPEDFLGELKERTQLVELWVGEGFALGRDRVGNVERIGEIGDSLGFRTVAMPRVVDGSEIISSSSIRRAIESGDVGFAMESLGRPFTVAGEVIHGAHLGREIGFPTANFFPPEGLVQLGDGIFVSLAKLEGENEPRPAMTYVGTRPTINSGVRQIETHLLDYAGDLYGQSIEVSMLEKLRDDQQFPSLDTMIAQLAIDEDHTRAYLNRYTAPGA